MSMAMTRKIALGLGVFYLGLGALGFVPTAPIGGLAVDPTHNLAHVFVGLVALWGSQSANVRTALTWATALFAGLMLISTAVPFASTALYFASAAIAAYLVLGEERSTTAA